MDFLREILRVVTSKSDAKKTLPELFEEDGEEQLSSRFLKGILDGKYSSDDEVANDLYGTSKSDQRYRTLKSRLSDRLMHALLFLQIKQPEHSEYLSYYYKCTRNLICSQTLLRFASRRAGTHLAERTLTTAMKYQFTDVSLALTSLLRESAGISMQRKEFYYYNTLLKKLIDTLAAEYRSEELYDTLNMDLTFSRKKKSLITKQAEQCLEEIERLSKEYSSHSLILGYHRMALAEADVKGDFESSIERCDAALKYLGDNPHLSQRARIGEFSITRMLSCLYTRKYSEALRMSDNCISSFIEAGHNWYLALDVSCASALLCGEYQKAEAFHLMATSHKRFALQNEITKEWWFLYNAYLNLSEALGLKPVLEEKKKVTFRLSTFLNSVPEFAKEKKIYNVHILILHAAFLIVEGNYDQAEKRIEYLRVYMTRYLKEKEFNRTRAFLRLLTSFPRLGFNAQLLRRDNAKMLAELQATANDPMPSETNEFIQYEVIYEQLLQVMAQHELAEV